ncbi:MAG: extracellular solute-binding protein [Oscillospiraceae bacterium]|nr:extracellular solute-binding protein [Oscillospiraceae bacterium]
MKRILSLLLAGTMALGLTACGKEDGSSGEKGDKQSAETVAQTLGYGYLTEYQDLNVKLDWVNTSSVCGDTLYVSGDTYSEEAGSATHLYGINMRSGEVAEVPVPNLTHEDGANEWIQNIRVSPDGSFYLMTTYSYDDSMYAEEPIPYEVEERDGEDTAEEAVTAEEPVEEPAEESAKEPVEEPAEEPEAVQEELPEPEESSAAETEEMPAPENMASPTETYTIYKCDMSGNILSQLDLAEAAADASEKYGYFNVNNLVMDQKGTAYIASETVIYCYDADGNRLPDITPQCNWINQIVATGDGTILITYYSDEGGQKIARIENGAVSEPLEIDLGEAVYNMSIYPGDGAQALLSDGGNLYTLDTATGKTQLILNWLDSDINGNNIQAIAALDADNIVALLCNWNRSDAQYETVTMKKTDISDIPVRTVLTMGMQYLDSELTNAIIDFNRKNNEYRITVMDYSQYNTEEDYEAGGKQLDLDIVSGNAPDIMVLNNGKQQRYIQKGVLANMSELMEADGFSQDLLVSAPLKAFTSDGILYGMPTTFYVQTINASAALLDGRTSWTLADMAQIISTLPEDAKVMQYYNQQDFLNLMINFNLGKFVDYGAATCSFDSDEFRQMLEAAKYLPADYEDNTAVDMVYVDDNQLLQSGELLMTFQYMSGPDEVKNYFNLYCEKNGIVSIGYPSENGSGLMLGADSALAVSASCQHKDVAWSFIKTLLSEDYQNNLWSFPVLASAFDSKMAETMEKSYYMDGDEKVYYDNTCYLGETEYTVEPLTAEQVEQFKTAVDNAQLSGAYDSDIYEIIQEEAAAFFAGDKSAEEVSSLIQNRVSIYLGENS